MVRRRCAKTSDAVIALARWQPSFPPGRIDAVYLHWSGGDYSTVYSSYHFCVALDGDGAGVEQTNDLRKNMRDLKPEDDYAAHTYRRNAFAAGIACMGMQDAAPDDFGRYPLTEALIDGLCRVAAALVKSYRIPLDPQHVLTHAEAAIIDGYFGAGDEERWDIARLTPEARALVPADAHATGDELRRRIGAHLRG